MPVVLAVVCAALAWLSSGDARWHELLDYRRESIAGGEAWRLLTAHLMHLSATHATLDIAALLLVGWIFGGDLRMRQQLGVCLMAAAVIDASLWFLHPEVDRYVGLSGLLHGWFAAGAVRWALASRHDGVLNGKRAWGLALLIGLVVKLMLESRHQVFWLGEAPFPVVTSAHRWGAAAGALYGVIVILWIGPHQHAAVASRGR